MATAQPQEEAGNPADRQSTDSFQKIRSRKQFLMAFSSWKDKVMIKYMEPQKVYVMNDKLYLASKNLDADAKEEHVRGLFSNLVYDLPKDNFCVVHDHTFYGVMFKPGKVDELETYPPKETQSEPNPPTQSEKLKKLKKPTKLKEFNSEHDFIALHPTGGIIFIEHSGTKDLTVNTIGDKQGQLTRGRDLMKIFVRQMMDTEKQEQQKTLPKILDRFFELFPPLTETDIKEQHENLEVKLDLFSKGYPRLIEPVIKEQQENLEHKLDLFSKLYPLLMETNKKQQHEKPEEKLDRFFKLYPLLMETDQNEQQKNLEDKLDRFFELFPRLIETYIKEHPENLEHNLARFFEHHPLLCIFPDCSRPTEEDLIRKLDESTREKGTRFFFREDMDRLVSTIKESFAGFDDCTIEEQLRKDVYRISLQCCITSSLSIKRPFSKSVKDVNEEMERIFLSSIQYDLVNSTEAFKVIGGPAGTGKTVIAREKVITILKDIVKREAWKEKIVLVTQTEANADSIREQIVNSFDTYSKNLENCLDVQDFNKFAKGFRTLEKPLIFNYNHIFIDDFETVTSQLTEDQKNDLDHSFLINISNSLEDLRKYGDELRGSSGRYFWIFCDPNQSILENQTPWKLTDELPVIFRTSYRIARLYLSESLCRYTYESRIEYGRCFAGSDVEFLIPKSRQTTSELLDTNLAKVKEQYGDNVAVIVDRRSDQVSDLGPNVRYKESSYIQLETPYFDFLQIIGREFDAVIYIPGNSWLRHYMLISGKFFSPIRAILYRYVKLIGKYIKKQKKKNESQKKRNP